MKTPRLAAMLALSAAAVFIPASTYALEIDCPPELAARAAGASDGVTMDEEMLKKRKKAREEELARLKARYMARSDTQVELGAQAGTAR